MTLINLSKKLINARNYTDRKHVKANRLSHFGAGAGAIANLNKNYC